ncbi:MAG: hypothetical protein ABSF35_20680 [Polyangia bacterium]
MTSIADGSAGWEADGSTGAICRGADGTAGVDGVPADGCAAIVGGGSK